MSAINGQAEVDTTVEELLIRMKIPGKTAGSVIKLTERTNGVALPSTAKSAEEALFKSGGMLDRLGRPILDLKQLTNDQKRVMGELFGENLTRQIVPEGQKLARSQGAGTNGIDDLYKVNRPDVDYIVIEYKFVGEDKNVGSQALRNSKDGRQGSESWTLGSKRLKKQLVGISIWTSGSPLKIIVGNLGLSLLVRMDLTLSRFLMHWRSQSRWIHRKF